MGIFDKLFGNGNESQAASARPSDSGSAMSADQRALAQYRYMLQTAPPQAIEQAHAEAFARLSPEQRGMLLQELTSGLPDAERAAPGVGPKDDPQSLARLATRAEVRQPGTLERTFGGMGGGRGMGMGGMMAGSFLSTIAGVVVGSAIAQAFLGDTAAGDSAGVQDTSDSAATDTTADAGGDGGDFDGGDFA